MGRNWFRNRLGRKHSRVFKPRPIARSLRAIIERLEERTVLSVQFSPGPYLVPLVNRADVFPGNTFGNPIEPFISLNPTDPGNLTVSSQNGLQVTGHVPFNAGGPTNFTPASPTGYPLAPT